VLLAISIVRESVPDRLASIVLKLCLAGLSENRDLASLSTVRSLNVSKILKKDLLDIPKKLSNFDSPSSITSKSLAIEIVEDLYVNDIRPVCVFLNSYDEDDYWKMMETMAICLEKNTQGKVLTGLKNEHMKVLDDILTKGISEFETDGILLFNLTYNSHYSQGNNVFSSDMYQSHEFER
jgi:hypothetical protein